MKQSLRKLVFAQVSQDYSRGVAVFNMGYEQCNDYAASVTQLVSVDTRSYIRFESVARYIRLWKRANKPS